MATAETTVVPFASPHIDEDDIAAVTEVLRSGWITTGSRVSEFEEAFSRRLSVRHAIALNSATAALHLALDALALKPGDEVIVPTITFTASAEVIRYFNAVPVLVDVVPDTLCIDPVAVNAAITPRTRAIMPVHFGGHAADMNPILTIAREHEVAVVEDAAHAFPCVYEERDIGTMGDIAAFSFYATKTITTGEGGMLLTNDDAFADRARCMALHGMSRNAWKRYTRGGAWKYDVVAPGFKYNMTDIAGALGLSQLRKADWLWSRRREIAGTYQTAFRGHEALETPTVRPGVQHSWHLYTLRLNLDAFTLGRDEFIQRLSERGVQASVHFIPVHTFTYYRSMYNYTDERFPVAAAEFPRIVSLPLYPSMTARDVDQVVNAVLDVCKAFRR